MEYIYAALVLHESDAEINEENLTNVLDAADAAVEESRVKALVAALEDVDIEDALEGAAFAPAAGAPTAGEGPSAEEEPEAEAEEAEEPEEEEEDEEDASGEGLGELFG